MMSVDKIHELIADTKSAIAEYEKLTKLEATELREWADELKRRLVAARSQELRIRQDELAKIREVSNAILRGNT